MPDYIEFENWPDIDKYLREKGHPFDSMTLEERYGEYLRIKNKNPMVNDEELSQRIGKSAYYFQGLKQEIRRLSCEKKLLRSV